MFKRGDNLGDYIGNIIHYLAIFLAKFLFALMFLITPIYEIISNSITDIFTTIFAIAISIFLIYLSIKDLKKVNKYRKTIKDSGRFNLYIRNIGQIILFITGFSIIPYVTILIYNQEKGITLSKSDRNIYLIIILISFILSMIIFIIDGILSSNRKNKNIIFKYDKYNK